MIKSLVKKITPQFLLNWYYLALPFLGAILYRLPSRKLKIIGVTGTNGKSTVVLMTAKILEEALRQAQGKRAGVASLSSISLKIADKEWPNILKMTMPGRFKIQKFLRQAVSAGCQFAVLEITSEGIKQSRHRFIDFDAAVFTNLSKEHIERHGSFENYREAKGKLFEACKNMHIINRDDENSDYFWKFPADKKIDYRVKDGQIIIEGSPISLNLKLPGEFNLYNAASAMAVGLAYGISPEVCKNALSKIENIPGRMETIRGELFSAIVDYAHTPVALEKVYQTVSGRKICVLGSAGGGRDKWKRPELGKIAAQYCDEIILTNEDPYDEPPEKILNDIKDGITLFKRSPEKCYIVLDRKEAIKKALTLAGAGDTVIITGKGCEPWMCVAGGKKIPWDDRQIVRDVLNQQRERAH